jgi:hypothetical protein
MTDSKELFEEAYYFPNQDKIYLVLVEDNKIRAVYDGHYIVPWTIKFEADFEKSVCLGTL